MVRLSNRKDISVFSHRVQRFMDTHGTGVILTCCHLNTYPNDTRYCSGHGLYGDNRSAEDCKFKDYCRELYSRGKRNETSESTQV